VSHRPLRAAVSVGTHEERHAGHGWLEWLGEHLDLGWRPGEWDHKRWLFTGDLGSDRTAAWPCAMPDCSVATRYHHRRCEGCRRARLAADLSWEEFDAAPLRRLIRPLVRGICLVPGCESELLSRGLCLRHERSWRKDNAEPVEAFIARARPLARRGDCAVAGCEREQVSRRGLCRFHDNRLLRQHEVTSLRADELDAWIAAERPLLGAHQFSLAALPELLRTEFLFALQRRDQAPPPLDPAQVRILLARLAGAPSVRHADPAVVCETGGVQYNSATRGLFRDLRRHLDQTWAACTGGPVRWRGVAGGAAGPAAQLLAALARDPGDHRLPPWKIPVSVDRRLTIATRLATSYKGEKVGTASVCWSVCHLRGGVNGMPGTPQEPGWWQATAGRSYPPHTNPATPPGRRVSTAA